MFSALILLCIHILHMSKAVFIIFPKLETRFNTHYQNAQKQKKGISNPLIKTALRLSSAKITLKVVWKR